MWLGIKILPEICLEYALARYILHGNSQKTANYHLPLIITALTKQRHDEAVHDPNTIWIYTDGSGIDGQIGAAAVCQTTSETRKQYIGTESSHKVYAAELEAIKLAADIVLEPTTNASSTRTAKPQLRGLQAWPTIWTIDIDLSH